MPKIGTDKETADLFRAWADRLDQGERDWDRPDWLRQALALLTVMQLRGTFNDIEHELATALTARLKHKAGEPPPTLAADDGTSTWRDYWRERAFVAATTAHEAMAAETPYLAGRSYVDAVTGPTPQPGQAL